LPKRHLALTVHEPKHITLVAPVHGRAYKGVAREPRFGISSRELPGCICER
jgi:hypothetical protein